MGRVEAHRGYLLVELLAAVTLLAVLFAAVVPGLVPRAERAREAEIRSRLVSLDAAARAMAVAEGTVYLRVSAEDTSRIELWSNDPAEIRSVVNLEGVVIGLIDPRSTRPLGGVAYDRLGRTDAFEIHVRRDSGEASQIGFGIFGVQDEGASP